MIRQWFRSGTPWIWLTGGAVTISFVMVVGVLGLIAIRGFSHFWPQDVAQVEIVDLQTAERTVVLGEIVRSEIVPGQVARDAGNYIPEEDIGQTVRRYLFKQGNRDQLGSDFVWHLELGMEDFTYPQDVYVLERREWGNFYGFPTALQRDGDTVVQAGDANFDLQVQEAVERSTALHDSIKEIEKGEVGTINNQLEALRLEARRMELRGDSGAERAERETDMASERERLNAEYAVLRAELDDLYERTRRDTLRLEMANGEVVDISLATIVRAIKVNDLSVWGKIGQYIDHIWEFLSGEPREANTEGGIFPAIFGTVTMVMLMSVIVTPFGVLAAIYLREYAKQGLVTRIIRVSVYNLAGVPSIVFGVFGLGFFVYFLGGNIDDLFFQAAQPSPTFGSPGLFWASLTLALLTLPVVIVSTEEGLARIPSTIRQGSLALGATKSETLWKVVVPLATPAMMTGLILAIARAAGEVAPLMLVGVVKLAPSLPIDGNFPYVHLERKIMHL
ncbi:MAG: phosphate ABC transporter permease PstA, partial [Natronospirillum sp.]